MITSSGKVVGQSISYETSEKYRTESVSFHLKHWLILAYAVVASTCMLDRHELSQPWSRQHTALPNDVFTLYGLASQSSTSKAQGSVD